MDHTFVSKTHFNHPEPAEFTEYMHASIAVLFGKQLLKAEKGKEIFSYCVEQYGRERGMRMAKRCLRDQRNLDWQAYADYREWNPSETVIKNNAGSRIQIEQAEPDRISRFLNRHVNLIAEKGIPHIFTPLHGAYRTPVQVIFPADVKQFVCRG